MRKYEVVAVKGGYAVAYLNAATYALVSVSDHVERASAERECRLLNQLHRDACDHRAKQARLDAEFRALRQCKVAVRQFADAEAD